MNNMTREIDDRGEPHRWLVPLALFAIVLAGFGLRMWRIAGESPWWDEVVTLEVLDAPTLIDFIQAERRTDPPMTPAYYTLAYGWSRLTSASVLNMRLLSVLLGMASLPLTFLVARRMFGASAGLAAMTLHSLSMLHIYYSQEIRVYALVILLSLISVYALLRALDGDRAGWWILHTLANAVLTFTHLFALLFLAAQGTYLVYALRGRRPALLKWIAAHAVVFLALVLWLRTVDLATIHNAAKWMVEPGMRELVMVFLVFAGGRASNENPANHLPTGISLDIALAFVLAILIGWFLLKRIVSAKTEPGDCRYAPMALLLAWLLVPIAILLIASFLWRPCFVYRYILFSSLPLYLLAGAAFSSLPTTRWKVVTAVLVLGILAHQLSALCVGPFRPDWRSAGRYLESNARPEDRIIVFQDLNLIALDFNSNLSKERLTLAPVWSDISGLVRAARDNNTDAWVVLWLWSSPANIENGFRDAGVSFSHVDFNGWPHVRVYHVETAAIGPGHTSVPKGKT